MFKSFNRRSNNNPEPDAMAVSLAAQLDQFGIDDLDFLVGKSGAGVHKDNH